MSAQPATQTERLHSDMMRELARSTLRELPMMPFSAVALGILGGAFVGVFEAMAWSTAMLATCVALWLASKRYLRTSDGSQRARLDEWLLMIASGGQAVTTVCFALVFWQSGSSEWNLMLLMIVMVSTILGVSLTATSIPTAFAIMTIHLIVTVSLCMWEGGTTFHALAALSPIFAVVVIGSAHRAHTRVRGLLVLAYERDTLIENLKAANQTKRTFMANMSHELRTPLNAILGFSEVMKDEVMGPIGSPLYRTYVGDIHTSGSQLLGMVNDILDLARIEDGGAALADDCFAVTAVGTQAVRTFGDEARKRDITLVTALEPTLAVRWDVRSAKQIAFNLMSNALKFTPAGGTITLSAGLSPDGGAWFSIRDTGCGIAPELHAKIFESFGQGRHDLAKKQGSGLGLAIVRGLVEAHGASIEVLSQTGCGATFTIRIPADRVVPLDAIRMPRAA